MCTGRVESVALLFGALGCSGRERPHSPRTPARADQDSVWALRVATDFKSQRPAGASGLLPASRLWSANLPRAAKLTCDALSGN